MRLLFSIFWILSINSFFVAVTKKKSDYLFPISIITCVFLLYFGGIIKHISYGYYLTYLIVAAFWTILTYLIYKKKYKELKQLTNNIFTVGFFVFSLLIIFVFFLNRHSGLKFVDEFTHWGPMVRETLKYDSFYCINDAVLFTHKDYPPFFTLLETLWCLLYGGQYVESHLFFGINIFIFSLFMPLFGKFEISNFKDYIYTFMTLFVIILLPLSVNSLNHITDGFNSYHTVYVDWTMMYLLAYCFFVIHSERPSTYKLFNLTLALSSMIMTKQMGIAFFVLVLMYYALHDIIVLKNKNSIKHFIIAFAIPFGLLITWKLITNHYGVSEYAQFQLNQINIISFINILLGKAGEPYQIEIINNYINAILHRPIIAKPLETSYFPYTVFISLLIGIIGIFLHKDKYYFVLPSVYLFGAIAYAFAMMILYVFSFGSYEGVILASFDRYLGSYLICGSALTVMLLIYNLQNLSKESSKYIVSTIAICLTLLTIDTRDINTLKPLGETDGATEQLFFKRTEYVLNELCRNKNVLIVEQYIENSIDTRLLIDYMYTTQSPNRYEVMSTISYPDYYTKDHFIFLLSEYDMIYLLYPDDTFIKDYWSPLSDTFIIKYGLYNIIKKDGSYDFEYVGSYEEF